MIREISFEEARPLLNKLWPDNQVIDPIDNTAGLIGYPGNQYDQIRLRFLGCFDGDRLVATSHFYNTSPTAVRMRGTYCEPDYRKKGISRQLFEKGQELFPESRCFYTFGRKSSEGFYITLGFERVEKWRRWYLLKEEYALMVLGDRRELPCFQERATNG